MDDFGELKDDYEQMNPWARRLVRDLVRDYRLLFPNDQRGPQSAAGVGAPKQLVGQGIESLTSIGPADPVGNK